MKKDQKREKYESTKIKLNRKDFPDYKSYKKEYDRQYTQLIKQRRKELYDREPERHRKYSINRYYRDYDKINERNQKIRDEFYNKESKRIKPRVEACWRRQNIKFFDDTFDKFFDTDICESCNCNIVSSKTNCNNRKVLDHCHFSGYARNIVCSKCNNLRNKLDNTKMKLHLELYRFFNNK